MLVAVAVVVVAAAVAQAPAPAPAPAPPSPSPPAPPPALADELPLEPLSSDPPAVLLAQADSDRAHGDLDRCNKLAQQALQSGQLDVDQVARAWMLRGRCLSLRGEVDKAQRAYGVLLRVQPTVQLDDKSDAAFAAAKQALAVMRFRAARVPPKDGVDDAIEVEILADDMQIIKGALLVRDGDELARFPIDAAHAKHRVSFGGNAGSGLGVGSVGALVAVVTVVAVVVDKHGNALARLAVADEPEHVVTPPPLAQNGANGGSADANITWLTTLGATAIGAGIVGVVTSGIAVSSLGPKALDEGQLWLVGVGASTGLFLVGASLVVVDQGLGPSK